MHATRRDFLRTAAALAAAASLGAPVVARQRPGEDKAARKLRVLILGGTGFLGPACTEAALARGHSITLFNRGRIEELRKDRGRPSAVPDGVEVLYGNRDPEKTADDWKSGVPGKERNDASPKGLSQLVGKSFDAVIDTSGYVPRLVKASAELLAKSVAHYVFISSISVYAKNDVVGQDESGALATIADPTTEEMGASFENYGALKALCEQAADAAMPGRVTNIRPGFIVGPRDTTARFLYWPVRAAQGGEFVVPGVPEDPIQIIDVRDLAEWIVRVIEAKSFGAFNATGPASELSMKSFADACVKGVAAAASPVFVSNEFLQARRLSHAQFPLYAPPSGETAGFHRTSIKKALAAGIKFRPVDETAKASYEWYQSLPPDVQKSVVRLMDRDKEAELLKAWRERS